jgi:hypothetical protein
MGILDFFKKKTQKNKYQIYFESISETLIVLARKKEMVKNLKSGESFVDLNFELNTIEHLKMIKIIKKGSISFLGQDVMRDLLEITKQSEIQKDEIEYLCNYLLNEQNQLRKLF